MTGPIRSSSTASSSSISHRPLNGVFGLEKPSGPTSMSLLESLKPLFAKSILFRNKDGSIPDERISNDGNKKGRKFRGKNKNKLQPPKIGQGGTLDPLADGVLVVGVGKGTKQLAGFLDCTKEYRAIGLLGSATTSYDSQDPILYRSSFSHVNPQLLLSKLPRFTGEIQQLPPLYSAIRMDGIRLFDYARKGIPLPRPIEKRNCRVQELRLVDWKKGGEHDYKEPEREVEEEEKKLVGKVREMAGEEKTSKEEETIKEETLETSTTDARESLSTTAEDSTAHSLSVTRTHQESSNGTTVEGGPPIFTVEMTVSSGTYVRSIVHDLASACDSAAHVVSLTRTRQGEFSIPHRKNQTLSTAPSEGVQKEKVEYKKNEEEEEEEEEGVILPGNCIPWKVFQEAIEEMEREEKESKSQEEDEEEAAMNGPSGSRLKTKQNGFQKDENGDFVLKEWEKLVLSRIVPC